MIDLVKIILCNLEKLKEKDLAAAFLSELFERNAGSFEKEAIGKPTYRGNLFGIFVVLLVD